MVALQLLDHFLASDTSPERLTKVAGHLVRSVLAELQQIELLDRSVAPDDPEQFDRTAATLIRGLYERWADETAGLLDRVGRLEHQTSTEIPDTNMLRHAHGRTRARLSISVDDMERSVQQGVRGETVTIHEIRRQLRARRGLS